MVKVAGNLKEIITDGVAEHMSLFPNLYRSTVPGPQGQRGPKGEQGISVHHIKGTGTTNPLGNFGVGGEIDTYTFYGDAAETINLGWFSISNGAAGAYDFTQFYRDKIVRIGDVATVLTTEAQTLLDAINELDSAKLEAAGGVVTGDLEVQGNFTVSGTATTVNSETVTTADNKIVINNGEVGTGVTNGEAGIEIDRGLATNYQFVFDEADDSFKIGEIGKLQKVATREDAPLDTGVAIWDDAADKFTTTLELTVNSITVSGLVDGRDVSVDGSKLDTIETNAKDDQIASEVPVTPAGNLTSTDVQAALEEVQTELDSATVHTTSDGSDHTFIDQDVTTTATPRFNSVQLNGGTGTQGTMTWNVDEETVDIRMNANTTLQVGQEMVQLVRNGTASTINNGKVVMVTGTAGASGRLVVGLHTGTKADGKKVVGMATEDIVAGGDGFVTCRGKVRGLDTTGSTVGEDWLEGDVLYIKPGNQGDLTKVVPADTELKMPIARVVYRHANVGTLMVMVNGVDENLRAMADSVRVVPQGNLSSITVQSALTELQADLDKLLVDKEW